MSDDRVNHPAHYGGEDNPYEAIKVIEAWDLNFRVGSAVKYIARAGRKPSARELGDIEKAIWYLRREARSLRREARERDPKLTPLGRAEGSYAPAHNLF